MSTRRISGDELRDPGHWERAWAARWDAREAMYVGPAHLDYWQDRAGDFSDGRRACDYDFGGRVAEALAPFLPERPDVLDVGAGPGSLIIPMSRLGWKLTAVEPVEAMLKELQDNARQAGITVFDVIQALWQDVDVKALRGRFDLAISSITMWMFRDLRRQLERLETVSRNLCCVVGGTGRDADENGDTLWQDIVGQKSKPDYSEFPLVFNLLHAMGRLPEVRMVTYRTERSVESKMRQQILFFAKYAQRTPRTDESIRQVVHAFADGDVVREECTASVVFWRKPQ